jgi:hypothetical protein
LIKDNAPIDGIIPIQVAGPGIFGQDFLGEPGFSGLSRSRKKNHLHLEIRLDRCSYLSFHDVKVELHCGIVKTNPQWAAGKKTPYL